MIRAMLNSNLYILKKGVLMNTNTPALKPLARELRNNATRHENRLWYEFLKNYPVQFNRQKVILNYIVDFYCDAARLVVELDGIQHTTDEGREADAERTARLEALDIKVIRFSNAAIDIRLRGVCREIHDAVCIRFKPASAFVFSDDGKTLIMSSPIHYTQV